jgi:hypothetical protein
VGGTATLTSHSLGYPTPVYQWYYNGSVLAGANSSSLTLSNLALAQAGNYQVTATNVYGSATSSVVALVLTNGTGFSHPVYVCDESDLRAAVAAGGWIGFGCNGTITLTSPLVVSNNVVLDGSLVNTTISGGGKTELFYITSGGSLTITNLTLANGVTNNNGGSFCADGGAIYNNGGTLNLVGCQVVNNGAYDNTSNPMFTLPYPARGGAIFNNGGNVTLTSTLISNNVAYRSSSAAGIGLGGAIFMTNGTLTLNSCILTTNSTWSYYQFSYGGAVCIATGSVVFANCQFNGNIASGTGLANSIAFQGGAVALLSGNLTIAQCQFLNNKITDSSSFYLPGIYGGGLYCAGTASIQNSSFLNNQITEASARGTKANAYGGAIYNIGNMTLNACCIASNLVYGLDGSQTSGGTSQAGDGLGAGIYNAGQLKMTNCTLTLNTAHGGIPYGISGLQFNVPNGDAIGAGLYNESTGTSLLMNVTLASNTCVTTNQFNNTGFSAGDQMANAGGTLRVHNSLLAYAGTNGNAYGTITDDGYNISSDGSAAFASGTSYNFTDPKLAALADNGGPTLTMALLAISPAIDTGDSSGAPSVDQRGRPRPFGSGYDMGAVEYGSTVPPVWLNPGRNSSKVSLAFSATSGVTYYLLSSTNLTLWNYEQVIGPFSSSSNVIITITPQGNGGKMYRVKY